MVGHKARSSAMFALLIAITTSCSFFGGVETQDTTTTSDPFPPRSVDDERKTTTTTAATTTEPLPTIEEIETSIEELLIADFEAFIECVNAPTDCNVDDVFSDYETGNSLEAKRAQIESYVEEDRATRPPNDPQDARIVNVISVEIESANSRTAVATYCLINGLVAVLVDDEGRDVIINDAVVSRVREVEVELGDDDQWRIAKGRSVETFPGNQGCGR